MSSQQAQRFESFAARVEKDPALAKRFEDNPGRTAYDEGVFVGPLAVEANLPRGEVSAAIVAEAASHPSGFAFDDVAASFYLTGKEASLLTLESIGRLIRQAYDRLSEEQKSWVDWKLDGLEAGMVAGILVWKLLGRTCPNGLVVSSSLWPRYNPLWTPPGSTCL
ncbi:MAG TPA: hypothetical protein VIJ36_20510 [Thermoanaerobaculia bacterium]|jgi:hypothetical protein